MPIAIVKLILLFCFSYLGFCFIQNEPYIQARPYGIWSKYITSQQNLNDEPSQYFLCGMQLKKRIQLIKVQRFKWRSWYRFLRSDLFSKTQIHRNMTNAINFYFCHYSNWAFQKIKTFNTNDNSTSQWNDKILCPKSYYVFGVKTVFSVLHGVDQGITGIRLHCMPMTFDHEVTVQDTSGKLVGNAYKSKNGSFISALKVKYVNNSEIVGLMLNTEYATAITSLNFTYQNSQKKTKTPANFSTLSKKNPNSQQQVQILETNKQIELKNRWQPDREYLLGYRISAQPQINIPNIQDSNRQKYKQKQKQKQKIKVKEKFQFGKQLTISLPLNFSAMTIVNSCTQVCLNTFYALVQFETFFTVSVVFGKLVDGGQVSMRNYTGVWRGNMISDIEHQIQSIALQDCHEINKNLRKQSSP